jgi:hypothetical protein
MNVVLLSFIMLNVIVLSVMVNVVVLSVSILNVRKCGWCCYGTNVVAVVDTARLQLLELLIQLQLLKLLQQL